METTGSGISATPENSNLRRFLPMILAWGAVLTAAPFPHRLHLGMGIECLTCHPNAATSTKATDNLLPSRQVCLDCHEQVEIPSPPTTNLTKFSHAWHLRMGNVAPIIAAAIDHKTYFQAPGTDLPWVRSHLNSRNPCQACHRGMEESDQVTRANLPQMSDCLVCHTKIEAPFSCWDCHSQEANLKPPSHVEHFMDTHSSGKVQLDKSTCAICHGRTFRCMGCHSG
jgi:predicted CXXCH cytochrome family protein